MNSFLKLSLLLISVFIVRISPCQDTIPYLQKKDKVTQLIIDGNPFIILGGELGNSSATTIQYMQPIWPKLKDMNLNTVLMPVYWELMEAEEGKFDFSLVKQLITEARNNNLKIVFLWFASWKNSMSSHSPVWLKLNQERFPRVKDDKNRSYEILTPFSENNLMADLNAFKNFMGFIKDFDQNHHTVIMVQVENEIGMLPSARDYHPLANEAFKTDVPPELINYMQHNSANLVPEFLNLWKANGMKISGNWEEVFGKGLQTDEIFMAWYFSKYTNTLIEAGKNIYPLPMFVNAALNRQGREPGKGYPSGGPLPHLMDVWKAAGSSIDFLAPDIYFPEFKHWCDLFSRQGNPLFIPEHRFDNTAAFKSVFAIGHYNALGFSPFSIESVDNPKDEPLGKMYNLIAQLSTTIASNQGKDRIEGVLLDKQNQDTIINLGKYEFTFRHDHTLGWSPGATDNEWPMASAILIQTDTDEFYIAGSGIVVTFRPLKNDLLNAGILKADEGKFENNVWTILRHLNGDQTHQGRHIRIPVGDYAIQRFQLYIFD